MNRKRSSSRDTATETLNVWPSFTDLMANAFMIMSLLLLLALFKSLFLKYAAEETELNLSSSEQSVRVLKRQVAALNSELGKRSDIINKLRGNQANTQVIIDNKQSRLNLLESEIKRLKSAPPVVVIQDSGGYKFNSGSAILPDELRLYISTDLVDRIEQISQQRDLYVVEIIGHTDGQVNFGSSNLDQQLESVALGRQSISNLRPGSNADLGLMRALEVVKQLQQVQRQGRLSGVQFRAYSAAQLQLPNGDFAPANRNPNASRRRIEIRFSPLGKAETIR